MTDSLKRFFEFFGKAIEGIMGKIYPVSSLDHDSVIHISPLETEANLPQDASSAPKVAPQPSFDFSTPKQAFHSVRVICDNEGLTPDEKNLICACIYQESEFHNDARNYNKNAEGRILSTDWGLCQVNDYYHIGKGKDFLNVDFVLQNPDVVVKWMISMYKHGLLKQWVSYSSGAYKAHLSPLSPMWLLKVI